MPFDLPDDAAPKPERRLIDRDKAAAHIQTSLGRVLTWYEYVRIWNELTHWSGRSDFLTGERLDPQTGEVLPDV